MASFTKAVRQVLSWKAMRTPKGKVLPCPWIVKAVDMPCNKTTSARSGCMACCYVGRVLVTQGDETCAVCNLCFDHYGKVCFMQPVAECQLRMLNKY